MKKLLLPILAFLLCSCVQDIHANGSEEAPQGKNPDGFPKFQSYSVLEIPKVAELSGICFNSDKSSLVVVGDRGDVAYVGFDGKTDMIGSYGGDFEAVTIDPDGNLIIAVEGEQMVYRSKAPSYGKPEYLFSVDEAIDGEFKNNGLEGITYYKDGVVFVGSQKNALLWRYKLDGTCISKVSLTSSTSEIKEIAGLCYDAEKNWLWVSDSKARKIFIFTIEGKLLASYDVMYIDNAESLCLDRKNRCLWVGSDESTSKLYRISLEL